MNSLTQSRRTIVNFIDQTSPKIFDWRFNVYDECFQQNTELWNVFQTVYWIGAIDLKYVVENIFRYPIYFVEFGNTKLGLIKDGELKRYNDGTLKKPICENYYEYNLQFIYESLNTAKSNGFRYFHVFIKETVDNAGKHNVSLLYVNKEEKTGVPSNQIWYEDSFENWIWITHVELHDLILEKH